MLKIIFLVLGFFIGCIPAYAQQISIEFGPDNIPIESYFTISVRLKGESLKQISAFPEIEGFQKSNRFTKKTTLKSGNNLLEEVHTQNYAALNEGIFVMEPFNITVNGKVVKSEGTIIQVGPVSDKNENSEATKNQSQEKLLVNNKGQSFFDLETSKKSVFIGEGVHIALYFYLTSAENGQLEFYDFLKQLPDIFKQIKQPNTWEESFEQTEILPDTVELDNTVYLRYKLYESVNYPLNNQDLVFPALELKMLKHTLMPDASFADEKRKSELKIFTSRPETVRVKSLPPHPLQETVPVGRYRLDEDLSPPQGRVDKPVTYTFSIIGEGNIASLPTPKPLNKTGLEIYPPLVNEKLLRHGQGISGSKQFTYTFVPRAPGAYNLSDLIQFIYFDPVRGKYDTLASRFTLQVKGAVNADTAFHSGVSGNFYNLIATEDNTLVSLHKFEKLKLYTNLIVLLLLAISVYIFFKKNNE